MDRRVVITGMGIVNCLGNDVQTFFQNLLNGRSGIKRIERFDPSEHDCQIAGEVDFDDDSINTLPNAKPRRMVRASKYAVSAARQALESSGFPWRSLTDGLKERVMTLVGANIIGMEQIVNEAGKKPNRVDPLMVPRVMNNAPAFWIQHVFDLHGPPGSVGNACASGGNVLMHCFDSIVAGRVDAALAVSTEDALENTTIASFGNLTALCRTSNDDPEHASRPFDIGRSGFVPAEGGTALMLEELEFAKGRNAPILAEIAGIGANGDGYHLTKPDPKWQERAVRLALKAAGIVPSLIDHIGAHGTSTPLNDAVEGMAIMSVLGQDAQNIPVTAVKSQIGHSMTNATISEVVAEVMMMANKVILPTINLDYPDPAICLFHPREIMERVINYAMKAAFGFGGGNVVVILKRFQG